MDFYDRICHFHKRFSIYYKNVCFIFDFGLIYTIQEKTIVRFREIWRKKVWQT